MTAPARRCLAELGLDIDPHRPVRELSVAQQQLVEIAKALHTESRVLLLDEPTASLSPREAERLFDVVRRLTERGTCVVFVSHKLEEVFAVCDTVTVLRDGHPCWSRRRSPNTPRTTWSPSWSAAPTQ